jgi:hypothetical protein
MFQIEKYWNDLVDRSEAIVDLQASYHNDQVDLVKIFGEKVRQELSVLDPLGLPRRILDHPSVLDGIQQESSRIQSQNTVGTLLSETLDFTRANITIGLDFVQELTQVVIGTNR